MKNFAARVEGISYSCTFKRLNIFRVLEVLTWFVRPSCFILYIHFRDDYCKSDRPTGRNTLAIKKIMNVTQHRNEYACDLRAKRAKSKHEIG